MSSTLFLVASALFGFFALAGLGWVLTDGAGAPGPKRIQAVIGGAKVERARRAGGAEAATNRRKQILQDLKASEKQRARVSLDSRLQQGGLTIGVATFWMICGGLGLTVTFIIIVATSSWPFAILAGLTAGLGLPRWLLSTLRKGRHKKFTAEFPNSIDIIVRGIKSGLPLGDCLKVIAAESPEPLATEFRKLNESLGMGVTFDQALDKMLLRMPTPELKFFAIVLAIQQKSGGNLAEALNNLSVVLRSRKLMVEKIKALSGEAIASAFIIGVLPPGIMILVTLTAPAYMSTLYGTSGGHIALAIGAAMMLTGIFVMRKMINFKF